MALNFIQLSLFFLKLTIAVAEGVQKILANVSNVLETAIQDGDPIIKVPSIVINICLLILKLTSVINDGVHTILVNIYNVIEASIKGKEIHKAEAKYSREGSCSYDSLSSPGKLSLIKELVNMKD